MKKQIGNQLLCAGLTAVLMMGLLAGCNEEKKVDYTIEGMAPEEQPKGEGGKSGLDQLVDEEVWKETWITETGEKSDWDTTQDKLVQVRVDAKVTVPKADQMSVVEVQEPIFDAAYKENIAERFFDSGEIYYGDFGHLTKEDLKKIEAVFDQECTITSDSPYNYGIMREECFYDLFDALDNIENMPDTYTPVEEYTESMYTGVYEGRLFDLTFIEIEGYEDSVGSGKEKRIFWKVHDWFEVCPEDWKGQFPVYSPWMKGNWVENRCQISEEEALKEAERFVEKLGLDYPVVSTTRPLVWGTPPEFTSAQMLEKADDWEVNGYVCTFDLGVDDISFVDFGIAEDYKDFYAKMDSQEEKQSSLKTQMQVYVTDKGIIQVAIYNPLEIIGITEGVELLPLDTVKKIIKEQMNEQWKTMRLEGYDTDFNGMELIYFRVRDKENPGKYSYVPAWRLSAVTKYEELNEIDIRHPVLINAIDGSLIDFYDET